MGFAGVVECGHNIAGSRLLLRNQPVQAGPLQAAAGLPRGSGQLAEGRLQGRCAGALIPGAAGKVREQEVRHEQGHLLAAELAAGCSALLRKWGAHHCSAGAAWQ